MTVTELLGRIEVAIGIQGPPRGLREVLEQEMHAHFQQLPIRAAEQAERMEERVRQRIHEKQQELEEVGAIPVVIIHHANQRRVMGSCWVGPTDTEALAKAKQARVHVQQILATMRALTPDQFERFGSRILRELGAEQVQVTRRSGDNGVDFYGFLSLGGIMQHPPAICQLAHNIQLLFAGQAKHYPDNPIGPATIREMIGAISLARYQVYSSEPDFFEEFKILPFNPLIALLFTTGRFTRGAKEIAESAGIIARSGEQLATFLADRNVGMVIQDGVTTFLRKRFEEWLNG